MTTLSALRVLVQAYIDTPSVEGASTLHHLLQAVMSIKFTFLFGTFTLLTAWSLTGLLLFHAMIISIAQTTNERVRNVFRTSFSFCGSKAPPVEEEGTSMTGAFNEADRGCCYNWYRACCTAVPVSRLPPDMSAIVHCEYTDDDESEWTGGGLEETANNGTGNENNQ